MVTLPTKLAFVYGALAAALGGMVRLGAGVGRKCRNDLNGKLTFRRLDKKLREKGQSEGLG